MSISTPLALSSVSSLLLCYTPYPGKFLAVEKAFEELIFMT